MRYICEIEGVERMYYKLRTICTSAHCLLGLVTSFFQWLRRSDKQWTYFYYCKLSGIRLTVDF